jgi:hypothetical protein
MSLKPLPPVKNEPHDWANKLRALGRAMDAQKIDVQDICILEAPNGFLLHARSKSKDGQRWTSTTREFSLSDFAMHELV